MTHHGFPRRRFVAFLGAALLSRDVIAQTARPPRVGMLFPGRAATAAANYAAFMEGMRASGYTEPLLVLERRYAEDVYERLDAFAAELVAAKVDVIVATTGPAVYAAKRATTTVPIVMVMTSDPVARGIIPSLSRPGGNVTGPASIGFELAGKHVELIHLALPKAKRIGILSNPDNSDAPRVISQARSSAAQLGMTITSFQVRNAADIDRAFKQMAQQRVEALTLAPDVLFTGQAQKIIANGMQQRLPTVYWLASPVTAGALMSYGPDNAEQYRRAASYVDRILKGANPAEMPAELPNKLELTINKKTAAAMGIMLPNELLLRADRVIE